MPIKHVLESRVPVKVWADTLEDAAIDQLKRVGSMPFVFKHVAAMPDVHAGIGCTIGTVVATRDAIMPACVGVDLGCGMTAIKLHMDVRRLRDRADFLLEEIQKWVPTGAQSNSPDQAKSKIHHIYLPLLWTGANRMRADRRDSVKILRGLDKMELQLGTIGGGNHFIELCESAKGEPWLMLHSGSRGVGNLIAQHHIEIARGDMKKMFIELPDPNLAYFVKDRPEFNAYIDDMQWAQQFAYYNRQVMLWRLMDMIHNIFGYTTATQNISCHHNYVDREHHFGENVWVTRKGAIRARTGDFGIIPGSMGDKSYIVRGLGNAMSFNSCSHGAGRVMSRTKARAQFTADDIAKQTAGVACNKTADVADEAPGAYRAIDQVMANQTDLVEVVEVLKQFVCVKGVEKCH